MDTFDVGWKSGTEVPMEEVTGGTLDRTRPGRQEKGVYDGPKYRTLTCVDLITLSENG